MNSIIFFDGVCHLCNGFIDTIIQMDAQKRIFKFAPLQGQTAKSLLSAEDQKSLSTVIYLSKNGIYKKSDAIIRILADLGGPYVLFKMALIVPQGIRDLAYDLVAKRRYQWFGEKDLCRLPKPEEKEFLLP